MIYSSSITVTRANNFYLCWCGSVQSINGHIIVTLNPPVTFTGKWLSKYERGLIIRQVNSLDFHHEAI